MWNDQMIMEALVGLGPIAYVPDDLVDTYGTIMDSQIQPASLDVRLGENFITHPGGERIDLDQDFAFTLLPGECVLGVLLERLRLPDNVVARIEGKSSWARQFLTVHSAGFVDPGFRGDITLELKNDGRHVLTLKPGDLIAQVSFQSLAAPAIRPYGHNGLDSHYQGQEGATPSWRSS
jgi:dCTP deaminase